jgi:D-alanyl-D-alanine carboxypeptidase
MTERLIEILEETCQETGAPAVAGIVVTHDAVVAQAAAGVRRLGRDTPVTLESEFHTGSNAKAMTATICASVVRRGLLRWATTPLEVFPELGGSILPAYEEITLEMLLRHMAGIPPYTDDETEDFVVPDWKGVPIEQQVTFFAKWLLQERVPVNEPGTQFSYSNAGYSIAAAMAEAATGQSWEEMLQAYLFNPLGMEAVAGKGWPALHDPSQPWGHYVRDGEIIPQHPDGEYQLEPFLAPAGDVSTSISAYGRFLQMNLRGLQGGESFLPSETPPGLACRRCASTSTRQAAPS